MLWTGCEASISEVKPVLQMNLATVAVLHTAMALEDPFDNQGLDGIYVDEALFEAEQVAHPASIICYSSFCEVMQI